MQHTATHLQHTCNTPGTHCNTLQHTATNDWWGTSRRSIGSSGRCNTPATHLQHTCSTPATHCNALEQTTYERHRDVRLDRRADATRLQQTCNTLHHAATLQARVCMGVYTSVCSREGGVYTLYVSRWDHFPLARTNKTCTHTRARANTHTHIHTNTHTHTHTHTHTYTHARTHTHAHHTPRAHVMD